MPEKSPHRRHLEHLALQKKMMAKRRKLHLEAVMARKMEESQAECDGWLKRFDANRDQRLDRGEFKALVYSLEPRTAPTEAALDYVFAQLGAMRRRSEDDPKKCEQGGAAVDGIGRGELRAVVMKYKEYLRRSAFVDEMMGRFDYDHSGKLECGKDEVRGLLEAVVCGSVTIQGDEQIEASSGQTFKIQGLIAAKEKGLLSDRSMRHKWERVTGTAPQRKAPASRHRQPGGCDVSDGDIDFVLSSCDRNRDGAIDREEIMASIAVWLSLISTELHNGSPRSVLADPAALGPEATRPPSANSAACSLM